MGGRVCGGRGGEVGGGGVEGGDGGGGVEVGNLGVGTFELLDFFVGSRSDDPADGDSQRVNTQNFKTLRETREPHTAYHVGFACVHLSIDEDHVNAWFLCG